MNETLKKIALIAMEAALKELNQLNSSCMCASESEGEQVLKQAIHLIKNN